MGCVSHGPPTAATGTLKFYENRAAPAAVFVKIQRGPARPQRPWDRPQDGILLLGPSECCTPKNHLANQPLRDPSWLGLPTSGLEENLPVSWVAAGALLEPFPSTFGQPTTLTPGTLGPAAAPTSPPLPGPVWTQTRRSWAWSVGCATIPTLPGPALVPKGPELCAQLAAHCEAPTQNSCCVRTIWPFSTREAIFQLNGPKISKVTDYRGGEPKTTKTLKIDVDLPKPQIRPEPPRSQTRTVRGAPSETFGGLRRPSEAFGGQTRTVRGSPSETFGGLRRPSEAFGGLGGGRAFRESG
jgi:hypothetical protein